MKSSRGKIVRKKRPLNLWTRAQFFFKKLQNIAKKCSKVSKNVEKWKKICTKTSKQISENTDKD